MDQRQVFKGSKKSQTTSYNFYDYLDCRIKNKKFLDLKHKDNLNRISSNTPDEKSTINEDHTIQ